MPAQLEAERPDEGRRRKPIVCPTSPHAFLRRDEQLDRVAPADYKWPSSVPLLDSRIATLVADALRYGESVRQYYRLYAWVLMPNHTHAIFHPRAPMPVIMRWLKGRTGRKANAILGRAGTPFWQDESFDHWIRSEEELRYLIDYVETNPVEAGLVEAPEQWEWSSARTKADDTDRSSDPP